MGVLSLGTYIRQVILKRYLLSRIALRPLKIVEPYLVEQERMANAQSTFEVWVEAFEAELMKPHGIIDRFFAREPRQVILKRRNHTTCMVFSHFSRFRLETSE